ncbi:MAG: bifunctional glutamate N-acetyltransferase/amino-acid acetyltransferase ArgJ [Opitutales bacterium]
MTQSANRGATAPDITYQDPSAGLADVPGFRVAATGCDIRGKGTDRLDLAMVYSPTPCAAAGIFTTNSLPAAPVTLCREHLAARSGAGFHALVVNSGNANACTGQAGMTDARAMARAAAQALDCEPGQTLVCSTGRIGKPLPMDRLTPAIRETGQQLAEATAGSGAPAGERAAEAILTSDTRIKTVTAEIRAPAGVIRLGAMAKGAGMIEPDMATMLAFIATDAAVPPDLLRVYLSQAGARSFNRITVDGDMSTNDTVLALANGASGIALTDPTTPLARAFGEALTEICRRLARKIVGDGERITKVVTLEVEQAASPAEAEKVARAVGNSLLVKSSWYGNDPNWGRIADAVGYAGVGVTEDSLEIHYGDQPAFVRGRAFPENLAAWREHVARQAFTIRIVLNAGPVGCTLLATDLTEGYVNFNKSE